MTRLLWFHPRSWDAARHGGDLRTESLVRSAVELGHEVTLVVPPGDNQWSIDGMQVLHAGGHRTTIGRSLHKILSTDPLRSPRVSPLARRRLQGTIETSGVEAAVVSEVMGWAMARHLAPARLPLLYDAQNVEAELFASHAARAVTPTDRLTFAVDSRRVARAERGLLSRAVQVVAASQQDRDVLSSMSPGVPVRVVPNTVLTPERACSPQHSPRRALFVGTLDYPPNVAAVRELVALWPRVRDLIPDAELAIVGRRPTSEVSSLAQRAAGVVLHADAPTTEEHYREARLVVAPLRSGGGTKLKVYEALSFGMPLVATPTAIHGIPVSDGVVTVAETQDQLVDEIVRLLREPSSAQARGEASRRLFVESLSRDRAVTPALSRVLEDLVQKA